ncbi:response regulator transcription factor [Paenibacillus pinihumi]|uniref:response regulator transcription factor n=1 Tax=Paenibacillus pinihumi TaxID=669462 RepID=UPI0003FB8875|nr:response regulator [Paenibacillus pinihumi]
MTIKMLIVDDEPIICRGLRETIPWEEIGVEVAGEAYDGMEALELLNTHAVDLILTDIHMDGMDGLSLSKHVREQYPHVRIMILSGYDDFDYARQAIRLGVKDYLLKPVNVDELVGMVSDIGHELRQESRQREEQERELWQSWLNRLLQSGGLSSGLEPPPLAANIRSMRVIASQLEDYALWAGEAGQEELERLRIRWEHKVQHAISRQGVEVFTQFPHPNLLIAVCVASCDFPDSDLYLTLENAPELEGVPLHFGVSQAFISISEAYIHSEQAIQAVQQSIFLEKRTVLIFTEKVMPSRNRGILAPEGIEKQLANLLVGGSADELEDVLNRLMQQFREGRYLPADMVQALKELNILIQHRLSAGGFDAPDEIQDLFHSVDIYGCSSYPALLASIRRELQALLAIIQPHVGGKHHWTVNRIKNYIESHYTEDLKASEVAAWLKITPNYFSILFNQYFGKGFAEYLNEVRIDHAKAMLSRTHDRVFEIAEKVGYNDYKYFCSIFKSYSGITPTQYRQLAGR